MLFVGADLSASLERQNVNAIQPFFPFPKLFGQISQRLYYRLKIFYVDVDLLANLK
jgi:hypothetical protein